MAEPGFWDDGQAAQKVIDANNALKDKHDAFYELQNALDDLQVSFELLQEEPDDDLQAETEAGLAKLQNEMQKYELNLLLSEPYDANNAILEIHPGAGGTEAQDWGAMLLRMYQRWADQNGYKVEVADYLAGDEAGLKSVTLLISGTNAYGMLRSERGVHRLVRISPFDAAGRRHTSFASVDVMPELDNSINIDVSWDDIKMEVFRSSGAGGQHINKTSSAVRMTHIPTNIVVSMQDQRSQQQNRVKALQILTARVYDYYESQNAEAYAEKRKTSVGTGDRSERIRTYNYPQNRVTDHRIGLSLNKLDRIMNGELDDVIDALIVYDQTQKLEQLAND